jgi:hypothetical protein
MREISRMPMKKQYANDAYILWKSEIYARKMIPFLIFWKDPLSGKYDLISIESLDESLCMIDVELSKEVIEEEYERCFLTKSISSCLSPRRSILFSPRER